MECLWGWITPPDSRGHLGLVLSCSCSVFSGPRGQIEHEHEHEHETEEDRLPHDLGPCSWGWPVLALTMPGQYAEDDRQTIGDS